MDLYLFRRQYSRSLFGGCLVPILVSTLEAEATLYDSVQLTKITIAIEVCQTYRSIALRESGRPHGIGSPRPRHYVLQGSNLSCVWLYTSSVLSSSSRLETRINQLKCGR